MGVKISTTNSKLGIIPSVNLPPIITCREHCPCAHECYARKGNFRYPNVVESLKNNYNEYIADRDSYFKQVKDAIDNGFVAYSYFRWHASGDIVDDDYFFRMVDLARKLPRTSFLVFTKKFEIVNDFVEKHGRPPRNLRIVFSAWGDDFEVKNPYRFPVAYVRFRGKGNNNIPKNALSCSGDCTHCLQCWNIEQGQSVVFNKH